MKCSICQGEVREFWEGVKCRQCGFVERKVKNTVSKENKKRADFWMASRRIKIVKKQIQKGSLLDVGCGLGEFLKIASKTFDVAGCDIDKNRVLIAREIVGVPKITHGDIFSIKKSFDCITFFESLQYIQNWKNTIKKVKSSLSPGGYAFFEVPNIDSYYYKTIKILRWVIFLMLNL